MFSKKYTFQGPSFQPATLVYRNVNVNTTMPDQQAFCYRRLEPFGRLGEVVMRKNAINLLGEQQPESQILGKKIYKSKKEFAFVYSEVSQYDNVPSILSQSQSRIMYIVLHSTDAR